MLVNGTTGNDSLDLSAMDMSGYSGWVTVDMLAGDDTLDMGSNMLNASIIDGGSGTDVLHYTGTAAQSSELDKVDFVETVILGDTETNIFSNYSGADSGSVMKLDASSLSAGSKLTLDADQGNRPFDIISGAAGDDITGSWDSDTILGGAGDDIIDGYTGDDIIEGGAGADVLSGGDGDDILIGGAGSDILNGGLGNDTVDFSSATAGINVNLATPSVTSDGEGSSDTILNVEAITGSAYDDNIIGSANADTLLGGSGGDDLILGGAGNDVIGSGDGGSYIRGDDGDDTLTAGSGVDQFVYFTNHITGATNGDTIINFTSGQDQIYVTNVPSNMYWYEVDNYDGTAISGGLGDLKAFVWDNITSKLWYDTNVTTSGNEDVIATFSSGAPDVGDMLLAGGKIVTDPNAPQAWTGTAAAESYTGGTVNDTLNGAGGNDTIDGGLGDDSILGGSGDDSLRGNEGNDSIWGQSGTDTLRGEIGRAACRERV